MSVLSLHEVTEKDVTLCMTSKHNTEAAHICRTLSTVDDTTTHYMSTSERSYVQTHKPQTSGVVKILFLNKQRPIHRSRHLVSDLDSL